MKIIRLMKEKLLIPECGRCPFFEYAIGLNSENLTEHRCKATGEFVQLRGYGLSCPLQNLEN